MGSRAIFRLSTLQITKLRAPGRYCDGGGLYLQIGREDSRSWIFRYALKGRVRDMGLGSASVIGLADARDFAAQCRKLAIRGIDPIQERLRRRQEDAEEEASALTFKECATSLIEARKASWRSEKLGKQWLSTLQTYVFPHFGHLPIANINTQLVMKALEPIWNAKPSTAGRVRQRVEAILDAGKARGLRSGDNPARWRGHLQVLLSDPSKLRKTSHHPALPYSEIGTFMPQVRQQQSTAARALELLILTATRTSETICAKWTEVNLGAAVWTIPGERIKTGREHRIPLSAPAVALLHEMNKFNNGEFIFPGLKRGKPLSNMAILKLLQRMGFDHITTHGFRSTFRDWAAEQTNFPRDVAEMALAHAVENKVEAAYRRGDLFLKRAKLMEAWASYCGRTSQAGIVHIRRAS
ncbi:MAG: integrase arm-type DNA-binding domain-containing protein [Pseudomonadota bacterium]